MEYHWVILGIIFLFLDLAGGLPIQPYPAVAVPTYTITGNGGYEITSTSSGTGGYSNSVEGGESQGEPYGVQQLSSGINSGAGTPQVFNFYNSYPVFNYQGCCASSSGCSKPKYSEDVPLALALPENFTEPEYAAYLPVPASAPEESYPPGGAEPLDSYLPNHLETYPPGPPLPPGLYAQPSNHGKTKDHLSGLVFPLPHEEVADSSAHAPSVAK